MSPFRICLMVEGQEDVTWGQWVALATACEEVGLEALFRSDHYLSVGEHSDRGSLDAWATLAALAAETKRIRVGTLVSPATFRHPSVLATMVVTADHVSGGRIELGMGAGWHEPEHVVHGDEYNTVFAPPEECRRRPRRSVAPSRGRHGPHRRRRHPWRVAGPHRDDRLAGTVEEVVERLQALEDAGVNRVMLQHLAHDDLEMVRLLGDIASC